MPETRRFALEIVTLVILKPCIHMQVFIPCSAAEDVAGDSEKVSRSRRIADDCFSAELKSEFCEYALDLKDSTVSN